MSDTNKTFKFDKNAPSFVPSSSQRIIQRPIAPSTQQYLPIQNSYQQINNMSEPRRSLMSLIGGYNPGQQSMFGRNPYRPVTQFSNMQEPTIDNRSSMGMMGGPNPGQQFMNRFNSPELRILSRSPLHAVLCVPSGYKVIDGGDGRNYTIQPPQHPNYYKILSNFHQKHGGGKVTGPIAGGGTWDKFL